MYEFETDAYGAELYPPYVVITRKSDSKCCAVELKGGGGTCQQFRRGVKTSRLEQAFKAFVKLAGTAWK